MRNDPIEMTESGGELNRWSAAQASVIGAMLIDERCCGEIFQATTPEMFSNISFRHIYQAIRKVWTERRPVDPVTVLDALGAENGSYANLMADCMKITPTAANVLDYCDVLSRCLRLSVFRSAAYDLLDAPTAEAAGEIWARLGKELLGGKKKRIYSYDELMNDFFDRMDDDRPPDYIDWGFAPLNEVMTVASGHFVVIGAESSVGKTALAFQFARHMAKCGRRVGFFSLETPKADAADRLMANGGSVPLPAIKHKRLDRAAMLRLMKDAEDMHGVCFDLIEAAGYSVEEIEEDTLANGYDTIFVDYMQLVNAQSSDEPSLQVRKVANYLQSISLRLNCTVIGLSQVTPPQKDRNGKRRELCKWDLRESKQIVIAAQAIMLLDLTDLDDYGSNRVMIVDKNKDGACGRMYLEFDAPRMRFRYLPAYEPPEISAARERNAVMDRNREARESKRKAEAAQMTFKELSDDEGGELPFQK